MNPVLLKPNTDRGAQVIVHGHAIGNMGAWEYHDYKRLAREAVLASYARLRESYEAIIVEGAGSPAEINLRDGDIANMGFAEAVDCPVILIADIDRGGVFAHIVGTLALLSDSEQARVTGFVINRFRGDGLCCSPGWAGWSANGQAGIRRAALSSRTHLDAEDAISREARRRQPRRPRSCGSSCRCCRESAITPISMPLRAHPQVELRYVDAGDAAAGGGCRDPARLQERSRRPRLAARRRDGRSTSQHHLRYGGKVIGICGGIQMLGVASPTPRGRRAAPAKALAWACST